MAKLHLFRGIEVVNYFRDYRIYLDDQYLGKLGRKKELFLDLEPGKHVFQAKIDWCSSQKYEFTIQENEIITLEVCTSRSFEKTILVLFFIHVLFILFSNQFENAQLVTLITSVALIVWMTIYYTKKRSHYLWIYRIEPIE